MKAVLLTTDTTHHRYFAWKVTDRFLFHSIFVESRTLNPPFETFHPFEARRDEYERADMLSGFTGGFADLANHRSVHSINDEGAVAELKRLSPDIILIFGTGKVQPEVIRCASVACLNLHGGNPEQYRGLDCHLWTIYHRDFANLMTTLHWVETGLDTGDIVRQAPLVLRKKMPLHELRGLNARACVELVVQTFRELAETGKLPARKQLQRGRYYSFMPAVLKEDCVAKFDACMARI